MDKKLLLTAALAVLAAGCSHRQVLQSDAVPAPGLPAPNSDLSRDDAGAAISAQRAVIDRISEFTRGKRKWSELTQGEQELYAKIYKRQLPEVEQAAWEKVLRARLAKENTTAGVDSASSLTKADRSGEMGTAAPPQSASEKDKLLIAQVKMPDTPPDTDLQATAQHIKEAWTKQRPISSLSKFEKQMYTAIYYRKLPDDKQRGWDKFLSTPEPSVRRRSEGTMVPVSLNGSPTH